MLNNRKDNIGFTKIFPRRNLRKLNNILYHNLYKKIKILCNLYFYSDPLLIHVINTIVIYYILSRYKF